MGSHLNKVLRAYVSHFQHEFEHRDQTRTLKAKLAFENSGPVIKTSDFSCRLSPAVKLKAFAFHSHAGVTAAFIDLNALFEFLNI